MTHRFSTWWRALGVVLLSLATVTWPSAARASTTPRFVLVHQSAVVNLSSLGTSRLSTTVRLAPNAAEVKADVAIYPAVVGRSQLTPFITDAGTTSAPLTTTGTFLLNCLTHSTATFVVTVSTGNRRASTPTCDGATPQLHLRCSGTNCDGVYPLRYSLDVGGRDETQWSLLALNAGAATHPLQVELVESLTNGALAHPQRSITNLADLGHFTNDPVTLATNYDALVDSSQSPTLSSEWLHALNAALVSPQHHVADAPPTSVDFAGLAHNGLSTQVAEQLNLTAHLVTMLTGRYVDTPLVLSGSQSPAALNALARAGSDDVVLPESDLTVAPSQTLTWGAPFHPSGANATSALSVDEPLSALVANDQISPGRRAALTIATLAFLHFEEPYAPQDRAVVITAPVSSTSPAFLDDLFAGFAHDALAQLSSLAPSFAATLVGTDGAPTTRTLVPTTPSTWTSNNITSLLTLIGAVTSFDQAIKSSSVATDLRVAVARAETQGTNDQRQNLIDNANNLLVAQLNNFSIDASPITLAGQGTSLPITVFSHAPYNVDAVVHLITDRLRFPKGDAVHLRLTSPTQSLRVPTADPRGSSLTLQVELTTPNGQVVLARSAVQVRIAGTSVVGYLLTFVSLVVLGLWWWRTIRRRSKGRHAR